MEEYYQLWAAEAETALQEVANIGAKDIYNSIKGKDLFKVPELWSEAYFDQVAFSAMAEAVGGFVMSTPGVLLMLRQPTIQN